MPVYKVYVSKPEVLIEKIEDNPRVKQLKGKARLGVGADGKPQPKTQRIHLRDALFVTDRLYTP